ncbi:MAG: hypothetical protein B6242_17230 [Anaerolineaceae bacterium 4572_78]|nr:MAG: hypothetical protein B6242_17230 [Anaerolineaceae bacterium 4572_78]
MKNSQFLGILAVIILIEQFMFGYLLKLSNSTRWVVSILTVLGWSYPIAFEEYGTYGEEIWGVVAQGFLVAGGIKTLHDLLEGKFHSVYDA